MRPIPESKLGAAVLATSELKEAHGAPIHIGDPGQCFSFLILHAPVYKSEAGQGEAWEVVGLKYLHHYLF